MISLTLIQQERLHRALEPLHQKYDPAEQMIRQPFSSPGYHTTLHGGWVHPTRDSLQYAVALLDTGEADLLQRAEAILRHVVALQDKDPASKTYGIWSWFMEEPLSKMSPPDWNWADFCGTQLLQVALDHRDRLPAELMTQVDDAIVHAARSIQRRNVSPGYTNIAIMGTYVTLVAANLYKLSDLHDYAFDRLKRFHAYTFHHGAFTEYNSPTYTIVALNELGRMCHDVKDESSLALVNDTYRLAWEEIAQHFHAPTHQWAGPHSRCYTTLLGKGTLALIERATEGHVRFGVNDTTPDLNEHRLILPCPRDLEPYFTTLDQPRALVKTFVRDEPPVVGTTYLAPAFALGSINRGDLWNQRRALLAYWGTPEHPSYLHLRFLHDGYDFSAAQFFSVQQDGKALAGINFAVDGGDTHVSLDRIKNATFQAKDLRLRFEIGGAAGLGDFPPDFRAPAVLDEVASLRWGAVHLQLMVPYASLGNTNGHWEIAHEKDKACLDVVLYNGPQRSIHLPDMNPMGLGCAVQFSTTEEPLTGVTAKAQDGRLEMQWGVLNLSLPLMPDKAGILQKSFQSKTSKLI
ncbi:MAG: hypothetical protein JO316_09935 [Abitibacteriaceae bacterium]|nr:hypothetical protein [Abditibacteriaceae bacterium]